MDADITVCKQHDDQYLVSSVKVQNMSVKFSYFASNCHVVIVCMIYESDFVGDLISQQYLLYVTTDLLIVSHTSPHTNTADEYHFLHTPFAGDRNGHHAPPRRDHSAPRSGSPGQQTRDGGRCDRQHHSDQHSGCVSIVCFSAWLTDIL